MAIVTAGCGALHVADRSVRILRWTFRRDQETVVYELGLTGDSSAYELRVDPPGNPAGVKTELFDDAMSALQRHAAIERILVIQGWTLEGFTSDQILRTS
jgi:hypothetical protein